MADTTISVFDQAAQALVKVKMIDNGDGTYTYSGPVFTKYKDVSAVAIGAIASVWTPAAGKKVRLMGMSISVDAPVSVLFEDNAAGADKFLWRTGVIAAGVNYKVEFGANGILLAAANNILKATGSGAANLTGTLYGREE